MRYCVALVTPALQLELPESPRLPCLGDAPLGVIDLAALRRVQWLEDRLIGPAAFGEQLLEACESRAGGAPQSLDRGSVVHRSDRPRGRFRSAHSTDKHSAVTLTAPSSCLRPSGLIAQGAVVAASDSAKLQRDVLTGALAEFRSRSIHRADDGADRRVRKLRKAPGRETTARLRSRADQAELEY